MIDTYDLSVRWEALKTLNDVDHSVDWRDLNTANLREWWSICLDSVLVYYAPFVEDQKIGSLASFEPVDVNCSVVVDTRTALCFHRTRHFREGFIEAEQRRYPTEPERERLEGWASENYVLCNIIELVELVCNPILTVNGCPFALIRRALKGSDGRWHQSIDRVPSKLSRLQVVWDFQHVLKKVFWNCRWVAGTYAIHMNAESMCFRIPGDACW
jgi:hypothetical protein